MAEFSFGQAFQDEMLVLMIRDYGFAIKAIKYISIDRLYSESHKYLFGIIQIKINEEGTVPSLLEAEDQLKYIERSKRRMFKAFLHKIYDTIPTDVEYIKNCLSEYSKKTLFVEVFQEAQTIWNSGKHDDTYKFTLEGMNEVANISFRDDINVVVEEFEEHRQRYIEESKTSRRRIKTGIDDLDRILGGGLAKTEMGIILADTKVGKSIGLVHMGTTALRLREGIVAHFVLEGSTEQTMMRYQSRWTKIPYNRIRHDQLEPNEKLLIEKIDEVYKGKLELIPFNTRWDYTIQDVEGKIVEMERRGKMPDLVIVDYGDLLTVPRETGRFMEYRHQQAQVFRGLKQIAMIYKIALWTASQTTKPVTEPEKETLMRARNVSEAYEKVRITDLLVTLNQTPREKQMGLMRILIDLYRDNETDKIIRVIQDFSKMIFYDKWYGSISYEDYKSRTWS